MARITLGRLAAPRGTGGTRQGSRRSHSLKGETMGSWRSSREHAGLALRGEHYELADLHELTVRLGAGRAGAGRAERAGAPRRPNNRNAGAR